MKNSGGSAQQLSAHDLATRAHQAEINLTHRDQRKNDNDNNIDNIKNIKNNNNNNDNSASVITRGDEKLDGIVAAPRGEDKVERKQGGGGDEKVEGGVVSVEMSGECGGGVYAVQAGDDDSDEGGGGGGGGGGVAGYVRDMCSMRRIHRRFPITRWLPKYSFKDGQCDVIAGFTVGLTVIPQALAYATIAKLPPQYGLYSAFMGCFLYTIFGTSKDITLGPTAIMSLLTGAYMVDGDPRYAVLLTFLAGCIQLIMGIFNLGFLINFLSHPVLSGFVSAAAIIIAFGQVKNILGVDVDSESFVFQIYYTFSNIPDTRWQDLILGGTCLVILILMKKLKDTDWVSGRRREGEQVGVARMVLVKTVWLVATARNAVVVLLSAVLSYYLSTLGLHPFTLTSEVAQGLPPFRPPPLTTTYNNQTVTTTQMLSNLGSGIAVVPLIAILESIVIGKAFAKQNRYKIDPTQEMMAIGLCNIFGSFFSSYPVTGSFSRTAVNSQSGVRTPMGGVTTGILVLLALGLLASTFSFIPKTALAAVIITAVIPMIDYVIVRSLWRSRKLDLIPLFITFLTSLFLNIEYGIIVGIGVSVCFLLYPMARPGITIAEREMVVFKPLSGLYFPAVEYIKDKVASRAFGGPSARSVILDCSHISGIDSTTIESFHHLIQEARQVNKRIIFTSLRPHLLLSIQHAHIEGFHHTPTLEDGVSLLAGELTKSLLPTTTTVEHVEEGGDGVRVPNGTATATATSSSVTQVSKL